MWKIKKEIYRTYIDLIPPPPPCTSRHLTEIFATPNLTPEAGCSEIAVSFYYTDDPIEPELLLWNSENSGQLFTINRCIDLSTLTYAEDCIGRIQFEWNDTISCC